MNDALDVTPSDALPDQGQSEISLDKAKLKAKWAMEIERYERKAQTFEKNAKKINARYVADKKDTGAKLTTFNVLWSNIQTLKPALYSKDPTPEVDRRFKDKDPVGLIACEVLENCIVNTIAQQNFGNAVRQAVLDRLLAGRGVLWPRYLPHFRKIDNAQPESEDSGAQLPTAEQKLNLPQGDNLTSDAPEDIEEVHWEEVKFDFVPYTDFGHTVARTWEEIDAIWRISFLDRHEVRRRFGDAIAAALPFDQKPDGLDNEGENGLDKAKIYEIWDKRTKRVIRLHKTHPEVLEIMDDPLELEGFWPIPKPLQATTSSKSFIPTADAILWQDQAAELDRLSHRITMLTRALKVVGVYDASVQALAGLLSSGNENTLIAVDSFAAFAEKGGLKGSVELLELTSVAEILMRLYEARDKVKADIYEISGLSDLLRGASDPSETATAQEIKSNYASVRLKDMQREVQIFVRDAIKIAAQMICTQFSLSTIQAMSSMKLLTNMEKQQIQVQMKLIQQYQQQSQELAQQHQEMVQHHAQLEQQRYQLLAQQYQQSGMQPPPQPQQQQPVPFNPQSVLGQPPQQPNPQKMALMSKPSWEDITGLLQNAPEREFRIDIETDSTILQDERQEQAARMQFAETIGKLIQNMEGLMQNAPELAPAIGETFMFVLRSFKVGRSTESAFEEAVEKMVAKAANPPPPQPNPEQVKAQAAMQQIQAKAQADAQADQARTQADAQLKQADIAAQEKLEQFKAQMQMQIIKTQADADDRQNQRENAMEAQRTQMEAANEQRLEQLRMHLDAQNQQMQKNLQLIIARLNNEAKIEVAEIAAQTQLQSVQISAAKQADSGND
jgi:hypothetical protein